MKKLYLLVPLMLLFCSGCSHPTSPSTLDEYFFPIELVSRWYYTTNDTFAGYSTVIWENSGTVQIDNKTYFKVTRYYQGSDVYLPTYYFRKENSILYMRLDSSEETVFADFSLGLNAKAYWINSLSVTAKDYTHITFSTSTNSGDFGLYLSFEKYVGITRWDNIGITNNSLQLSHVDWKAKN